MSVAALRPPADIRPRVARLLVALAAVAIVAALVAILVGLFAPATPVPPARNPFGMGLREAAPGTGGLGRLILSYQSAFFLALKTALGAVRSDPAAAASLIGLGFSYGVFHAAGPGHGKAVISAYILSSERALARGIALSFAAALIQAIVAVALVGAVFVLVGGTAATMSRTAGLVEMAGFAVVAGLGALVTWRKAGRVLAALSLAGRAGGLTPEACGCEAGHPPAPGRFEGRSLGGMAAVALGAGIRPCAGAILILVLALSQHLFAVGVAATFAMALGTAITTSAIAATAVYAKRLALRFAGGRQARGLVLVAGLELAAAAFVLVLGLSLLTGTWSGEGGI